ncbi:MAG TPA: tetratricopeptide repeat protein [Phycisphaerae bacterium]|nr:tetratricopeptide repeat protein [Phycisphaerae bacterium]
MPPDGLKPPRFDRWLLAVGVLGVAVRCAYLIEGAGDPTFAHPIIDCGIYDGMARELALGRDPWLGPFTRPPLYPYFVAAIYWVSGFSLTAVRFIQALLGGATCVLTFLLGKRLFDRRVGLTAGMIVALYGPLVFFDERLLDSSLVVFCHTLALLLGVWAAAGLSNAGPSRIWYKWLVAGAGLGVAAIARPNIGPFFLAFLLIWLLATAARRRRWAAHLAAAGCLLVGVIAPIVPVTVRNYVAGGEFIPISLFGGINLYIGNNPDAERTTAIRPGPDWDRMARLPHAEGMVSPARAQSWYLARVADYVRNHPGDFAAGLARKTRLFLNAREVPRVLNPYLHRRFSSLLGVLTWQVGPFGFPFGIIAPLAFLGMIVGYRGPPQRCIPIGYLVAAAVSVILFFVASRYRLPIVPVLAVFAAWAVFWLRQTLLANQRGRFAVGVAAVVGVGVLVNLPARAPADLVNFEAEFYDDLGRRLASPLDRDYEAAEEAFRQAIEIAPDSAELHISLAEALRAQGRVSEAVSNARTAIQLDPNSPTARLTLGLALRDARSPDAAIAALRQAVALDPTHPGAHALLAQTLVDQRRYSEAVEHFRQAVKFQWNQPAHHLRLADTLTLQKAYADAIAALEAATDYTESPAVTHALAWLLATCPDDALRDPARALTLAQQAVRDGEPDNPVYLDTLAAAYAANGRFAEAAAHASRAVGRARATAAAIGGSAATAFEQLADSIEARRQLYLAGQPCHDPERLAPG